VAIGQCAGLQLPLGKTWTALSSSYRVLRAVYSQRQGGHSTVSGRGGAPHGCFPPTCGKGWPVHEDVQTIAGPGCSAVPVKPVLLDEPASNGAKARSGLDDAYCGLARSPFRQRAALRLVSGIWGSAAFIKDRGWHRNTRQGHFAPCRAIRQPRGLVEGSRLDEFGTGLIAVVRFSGPAGQWHARAAKNGPPYLSLLQIALQGLRWSPTGAWSGASGKVQRLIHLCRKAAAGGGLALCKRTMICYVLMQKRS